jgi:hypothetical protein
MAVTFVNGAAVAAGSATSAAFIVPTVQDDDVAFVFLHYENNSAIAWTAAASTWDDQGFTLLDGSESNTGSSPDIRVEVYGGVLQAADSGTTITWAKSGGGIWRQGYMVVVRGADTTTLLRITDPAAATTGSDASAETPAEAATLTSGDFVIWSAATFGDFTKGWPATANGNTVTERHDTANNLAIATAGYGASAISSITVTLGGADQWIAKTIAVRQFVAATLAHKDHQSRFRLLAQAFKDAQARFKLLAPGYRDHQARYLLAARVFRDVAARHTLKAFGYRDVQSRFRLLVPAYRDVAARLVSKAVGYGDAQARFAALAAAARDHAARFTLQAVAAAYRDAQARFHLLALTHRDVQGRFALLAVGFRDSAARFASKAVGYRDAQARFLALALAHRDAAGRYALLAAAFRDHAARFALQSVAAAYRDVQARARLLALAYRDARARFGLSTPQIGRPDEDIAVGQWTDQSGGTTAIYTAIDEETPNAADYVQSPGSPADSAYEWGLPDLPAPGVLGSHWVRYQYGKDTAGGDRIDMTVELKQSGSVVASWTHPDVPEGPVLAEQLLSAPQVQSLAVTTGYYRDLSMRTVGTRV